MQKLSSEEIVSIVCSIRDIKGSVRERQWRARRDHPEFAHGLPSLFDAVCEPNFDMQRLSQLLELRDKVSRKEISKEKADVEVGQRMYDVYVKPVIGEDKPPTK